MKVILSLGLFVLVSSPLVAEELLIVDDLAIIEGFEESAGKLAELSETPRVKAVLASLKKPTGLREAPTGNPPAKVEDSIYTVGAVYDCGKCDQWHSAGFATAWVLGSEGIFCTNYHVVEGMKGEIAAVTSAQGVAYPVVEVLLADEANDIAIFRVEATGLPALPLAKKPAKVGEEVYCVSHPDKRFYTHTSGEVSRYYLRRTNNKGDIKVPFMAITADYARGSSGGPIMNSKNEVVGMVSNTSNINYGKKGSKEEGVLQMVIRNCVPAFKIQELLADALKGETEK